MPKHLLPACLIAPAVCLIGACSSLYVRSDFNPDLTETLQCHTVAWAGSFRDNNPLRETVANPLNESRLRAAIAAHFPGGVQPAGSNADCLIGYGIGSHAVTDWAYPHGWGYPWSWDWYGGYGWGPYVHNQGVIAVNLYDAKTHQPLWHASADQNLDGVSGAQAERRIDTAVAAILGKYPYPGSLAHGTGPAPAAG